MTVRSLTRGLKILQRLSTVDGLSINEVANQLKLPRGTSHRLIKTLEAEGFVQLTKSDNRYRLTPMAHSLGRQEDWESWVGDIAQPRMEAFTAKHLLPVGLCTLYGIHMVSRAVTDRISPFALKHYNRGYLASLTGSSIGLAFLAFCDDDLRASLIEMLQENELPHAAAIGMINLEDRLKEIRKQGYAGSPIVFGGEQAIAIPLYYRGSILGSLSLRFVAKAMTVSQAASKHLKDLQGLAADISTALENAYPTGFSPKNGLV